MKKSKGHQVTSIVVNGKTYKVIGRMWNSIKYYGAFIVSEKMENGYHKTFMPIEVEKEI